MSINPTYQSGFASPQRGRLKYPELWRGSVFRFAASLGYTGSVIANHGGGTSRGDVTTNATPNRVGGYHALQTTSSVWANNTGIGCNAVTWATARFTMYAWVTLAVGQAYGNIMGTRVSGYPSMIQSGAGSRQITYGWEGSADEYSAATSLTMPLNTITFCAAVVTPASATVYLRPVTDSRLTSWVNTKTHNSRNVSGAWRIGADTGANYSWVGNGLEWGAFSRDLSLVEITKLAQRPLISYEMKKPQRGPTTALSFKAAWLNQRSQIIGGGVR